MAVSSLELTVGQPELLTDKRNSLRTIYINRENKLVSKHSDESIEVNDVSDEVYRILKAGMYTLDGYLDYLGLFKSYEDDFNSYDKVMSIGELNISYFSEIYVNKFLDFLVTIPVKVNSCEGFRRVKKARHRRKIITNKNKYYAMTKAEKTYIEDYLVWRTNQGQQILEKTGKRYWKKAPRHIFHGTFGNIGLFRKLKYWAKHSDYNDRFKAIFE